MTILRSLKSLFGKLSPRQRRIAMAADQMWDAVARGIKFEVPAHLSTDDDTMQAIALLTQAHPQVKLAMHQSKGIIVGLVAEKASGITEQAAATLDQFGYYPGSAHPLTPEQLISGHERFMRDNQLDPKEMEREAQAAQANKERIETTQAGVEKAAALDVGEGAALVEVEPEPSQGALNEPTQGALDFSEAASPPGNIP